MLRESVAPPARGARPVSLHDRIQTDIATAMRGGDTLRRDVLRMAASAAYNVAKKQGRPLTDDEYVSVLSREVKTRRESVEAFTAGGRADAAAKEQAEIEIIRAQQIDEAYERMVKSDVKYRFVIDCASLRA